MDGASSDSDDGPPEALSSKQHQAPPRSSYAEGGSYGANYDHHEPHQPRRLNRHRPSERSTREPVSTFRIAPGLDPSELAKRKRKDWEGGAGGDPRFVDSNASADADFDEAKWRKSYDFLFEQQKEEVGEMKRRLSESSKASKRAKQHGGGAKRQRVKARVLGEDASAALKIDLERAQNRLIADERKQKKQQVKSQARAEEVAAVKEGKKPFFQKKSALRERELLAQYEELKKKGQLDKFLERRRKKVDAKQHRRVPGSFGGWDGGDGGGY